MSSTPSIKVADLAAIIGAELRGEPSAELSGVSGIDHAGANDLTFARDAKNAKRLERCRAGAAIVSRGVAADAESASCPVLIVDDADAAIITLLGFLSENLPKPTPGVHPKAHVDSSAEIDPTASIGPGCSIGPMARVGARSVLGANVVIEHHCQVGNDCILHPGVIVGTDGFAYLPDPAPSHPAKVHRKIPHIGNVEIADFVEIGANTCIDRGKFGPTRIGPGTKIDNLVQIGHNCQIGACCVLCAQVGLAGSVKLGDGVVLAGQVGIADNVTLGSRSTVGAGSGLDRDVPAGETWFGYPAAPGREVFKQQALLRRLLEKRAAPRAES